MTPALSSRGAWNDSQQPKGATRSGQQLRMTVRAGPVLTGGSGSALGIRRLPGQAKEEVLINTAPRLTATLTAV